MSAPSITAGLTGPGKDFEIQPEPVTVPEPPVEAPSEAPTEAPAPTEQPAEEPVGV